VLYKKKGRHKWRNIVGGGLLQWMQKMDKAVCSQLIWYIPPGQNQALAPGSLSSAATDLQYAEPKPPHLLKPPTG